MKRLIVLVLGLSFFYGLRAQEVAFKRGISVANSQISEADLEIMDGKLSWYYNWGTAPESQVEALLEKYNVEYIPMAWNGYFSEESMREFYENHPEAKYLLGFNEPNFIDQANMTPSEAAAVWPRLEAIADEFDLELVSPAVNWCGNCVSEGGTTFTNPYEYLDAFFEACPDCRVDYIAVHVYMCYAGAVADYLDGFKKYGKKIWLTEFNCWDQSNITVDMQKNLMIGALDHMDNDTMIYRYAWFIGRSQLTTSTYDIFESDPGMLTELGEIYFNFDTRHDTSVFREIPGRIEAESYSAMSGIQLELTSDFEGMANVGWFDSGDWLQYNLNVPEAGYYNLFLRLASNSSTSIKVWIDDVLFETIDIPYTGGWQDWETFKLSMPLEAGRTKLKLGSDDGGININWILLKAGENSKPLVDAGEDMTIPYTQNTITLSGSVSDQDGDKMQYSWRKLSGFSCEIISPDSIETEVSGLQPGTYRFRLAAYDGIEDATDDLVVTVEQAPVSANTAFRGGMKLFPNPSGSMIILQGAMLNPYTAVSVFDSCGRVCQDLDIRHLAVNEFYIDIASLPTGIYVLKAISGTQSEYLKFQKL